MGNDLVNTQKHELTSAELNEWGMPVMSQRDIIIPKILPMQGLSVAVAEGRSSMGEFRDSLSNDLIGKIDQPFECIPFYMEKLWDISEEQEDGSFKWKRTIPVVENPKNPEYNDNWGFENVVDGIKVKQYRRLNFFVLLPKDIASGESIPYIFGFKSTSLREGMKLMTQMYVKNLRAGIPPAAYTISVGGVRQKNDKGIFIVPNYTLGRKTTVAEMEECKSWIGLIKSGKVKVDESDIQNSEVHTDVTPNENSGVGQF